MTKKKKEERERENEKERDAFSSTWRETRKRVKTGWKKNARQPMWMECMFIEANL